MNWHIANRLMTLHGDYHNDKVIISITNSQPPWGWAMTDQNDYEKYLYS